MISNSEDKEEHLEGKGTAPIPERDKHTHVQGDMHYGFLRPRDSGMRKIFFDKEPQITKDDPWTVRNISHLSGIKNIMSNDNKKDVVQGYFRVLEMLKHYSPVTNPSMTDRWVAFLKDHRDYLQLDKQIEALKVGSRGVARAKDRLLKNNIPLFAKLPVEDLRNAVLEAFEAKGYSNLEWSPELKKALESWVIKAYNRRISKLLLSFVLKEAKTVHFNVFSAFNQAQPNAAKNAENLEDGFQPITFSELRYINRKYGHMHPQIDIYYFNPDVVHPQIERTPELGDMPNYKARRGAEEKEMPIP